MDPSSLPMATKSCNYSLWSQNSNSDGHSPVRLSFCRKIQRRLKGRMRMSYRGSVDPEGIISPQISFEYFCFLRRRFPRPRNVKKINKNETSSWGITDSWSGYFSGQHLGRKLPRTGDRRRKEGVFSLAYHLASCFAFQNLHRLFFFLMLLEKMDF